jgi:hypothetical protein
MNPGPHGPAYTLPLAAYSGIAPVIDLDRMTIGRS